MNEDRISRLGALSGVLFVVLELAGAAIGQRPALTLGDPTSKVIHGYAAPFGNGGWVGSYLELISLAAFAVFAATLFRARRSTLSGAGLIAAASYVSLAAASLIVGDVLQYRAGHGLGPSETLTLFDLQSGLFVATWAVAAGLLALAPVTGWLRRVALAIALLLLVGVAAPKADFAQAATLLFLAWTLVTSIVLARRPRASAPAAVPAGA
jgi:hypothetical protein